MGSSPHHTAGALGRSLCLCIRRAKQSLIMPDNRHSSPSGEQWSSPRVSPTSQPLSHRTKPSFSSSTVQRDLLLSQLHLSSSKTTLCCLPLLQAHTHRIALLNEQPDFWFHFLNDVHQLLVALQHPIGHHKHFGTCGRDKPAASVTGRNGRARAGPRSHLSLTHLPPKPEKN